MVALAFLTNRCGKSIEKREWGEGVAYFMLALADILFWVKNTSPF
jgi:hypothetical protein